MNPSQNFSTQAKELIDDLKSVCANNGLGNDGNEFKIITQIFLYKFLNDKFAYQAKQIEPSLAKAEKWEEALAALPAGKYKMLLAQLGADTAKLKPEHLISTLYNRPARGKLRKHPRRHPHRHRRPQCRDLLRSHRRQRKNRPIRAHHQLRRLQAGRLRPRPD
jgi:hypothetical protein